MIITVGWVTAGLNTKMHPKVNPTLSNSCKANVEASFGKNYMSGNHKELV